MFSLTPDPDTPAGPYTEGDQPPGVSAAIVDEDGQELDVSTLSAATGTLVAPAGTTLALPNVALDEAANRVTWDWPSSPFQVAGIYGVDITIAAAGPTVVILDTLPVVVENQDGWLSLSMARRLWPDAPHDDVALFLLLETARVACASYAPALAADARPPANYLEAQLAQARSVWNLMQTAPQSDLIGYDQSAVRVYPLDYNVRQLLRPKQGRPVLF